MPRITVAHDDKSQPPFALALDIGTSSVRASLFDERGNEIEGSAVRHARRVSSTFDGGAELNADEATQQVERAIDAALAYTPQSDSSIEIVVISCFWHSLLGVDGQSNAVTPVLGWADTRAAQMVEELRRLFDESETHARTGCRFHATYWPAKLLWLQRHRDDTFRSAVRWMSFSDFLFERLFGESATSVSMASGTGLLDQRHSVWDKKLLSSLSLSPDQLPSIAESGKTYSALAEKYASRWPQLKNARWFPAIGDGAANNIGVGCVTRQFASLMVGTSGAMRVMWRGGVPDALPQELWCYRADYDHVIAGGALSDGGGLFDWMKNELNLKGSDEEIERALDEMQPDSHGLTVLPFWAGERSTGWNAAARGAILGLRTYTRPIDILRAAMEAIAYRFALIAEALVRLSTPISIIASGGALRASRAWTQMLADVLGQPILLSDVREASSRGAVLLALHMAGRIKSIADVPVPSGQSYAPEMTRHAQYREALRRQQEFYQQFIANQAR